MKFLYYLKSESFSFNQKLTPKVLLQKYNEFNKVNSINNKNQRIKFQRLCKRWRVTLKLNYIFFFYLEDEIVKFKSIKLG